MNVSKEKKIINDKYLKSKEYLQKRVADLEKELLITKYHLSWIIEVAQKGLIGFDLNKILEKQQPAENIDYVLKDKDKVEVGFKDHLEGFKKVVVDKDVLKDEKDDAPPPPPKPKTEIKTDKNNIPAFSRDDFDKEVKEKIKPGVMPSDVAKKKEDESNDK